MDYTNISSRPLGSANGTSELNSANVLICHERAYGQVSVFGKINSSNGIADLNSEFCLALIEPKLGRAKSELELVAQLALPSEFAVRAQSSNCFMFLAQPPKSLAAPALEI